MADHEWLPLLPPSTRLVMPPEIDTMTRAAADAVWHGRPEVFEPRSAEQRRLVALSLHHHECAGGSPHFGAAPSYDALIETVSWSRGDLLWSLRELAGEQGLDDDGAFLLPVRIAMAVPVTQLAGLRPVFESILTWLVDSHIPMRERWELCERYGEVIDRLVDGLPAKFLHNGDSFGPATREQLADRLTVPGLRELFEHAVALSRPVPAASWQRRADELLTVTPSGAGTIRAVLERFAAFADHVHEDTDGLLRGLACLAARDPATEVTALLAGVAVSAGSAWARSGFPFAPKTAAAAVEILSGRPGDGPVPALSRLMQTVRNKALRARVQDALGRVGAARGWAPGEALELSVPRHGLDSSGRRTFGEAGRTAVIETASGKAKLSIADGPGAAPSFAEARALIKEINEALLLERSRVESLFSQEREWPVVEWIDRYLDHPVTGIWARQLIWQLTFGDGTTTTGIPERGEGGWTLTGPFGAITVHPRPADPAVFGPGDRWDGDRRDGVRVRLWHPAGAAPAEIAAWREHVASAGLRQPFKQAFREVYLLTPAERETGAHSNRFTGHILRYRQAAALMRTRGWQAGHLGTWGGGESSDAVEDLAGGVWRAIFAHALAATDDRRGSEFCVTGPVRFERSTGRTWEPVSLEEVPGLVFSEAMRDVDLFVGVASIDTEEAWQENGETRFLDYRRGYSFGVLSEVAEVRSCR